MYAGLAVDCGTVIAVDKLDFSEQKFIDNIFSKYFPNIHTSGRSDSVARASPSTSFRS